MSIGIKEAVDFAEKVAEALTKVGIKPVSEYCGIITVLGEPKDRTPPIGCSLNYDEKHERWMVSVDLMHGIPANEEAEPS